MFDLSLEGGIATIIIHRGEKRNAVTIAGWIELERIVHRVNVSQAQVIVFRSGESGSFCAGADLGELWALRADIRMRKRFRGAIKGAMARIHSSNKPTVALVEGGCFGIGVSLATACDIRVASPGAEFAITPAQFGISYPQGDLARLIELVGRGQGARLIFGCERIDAMEAHRIGLADILDEDGKAGEALLQSIAANAPNSLAALKAGLLNRFGSAQNFDACFGTPHFAERYGQFRSASGSAPVKELR